MALSNRVAVEEDCNDYWLSIVPVAQREQARLCSCHRPLLWFCSLGLLTQVHAFLLLLRGMLGWRVPQTVLDWSIWRQDEAEAPSIQVNSWPELRTQPHCAVSGAWSEEGKRSD